jgi:hypothetical protein
MADGRRRGQACARANGPSGARAGEEVRGAASGRTRARKAQSERRQRRDSSVHASEHEDANGARKLGRGHERRLSA